MEIHMSSYVQIAFEIVYTYKLYFMDKRYDGCIT